MSSNNIQTYREFCVGQHNIPVFSQPWWLDAAAGVKNWDVIIVTEGDKIVATLPYVYKKKRGLSVISQPALTQKLGITFHGLEMLRYNKRLSAEKRIVNSLLKQLPRYDIFSQTFDHSFTNWLPFYWHGFKQTTNYSYVIDDISSSENIIANFTKAKRKDFHKAKKVVTLYEDMSAQEFFGNHKTSLAKQGRQISYSETMLQSLFDASYSHNSGKVFYAKDKDNNIHAAIFIIWDQNCAYYLISTIDPDYRISGSTSYLLLHVFNFLKDKTKAFDFEGSMIENVEYSFRQFGGQQKHLYHITHVKNRFIKAVLTFMNRI